jgi:hypothetical protein
MHSKAILTSLVSATALALASCGGGGGGGGTVAVTPPPPPPPPPSASSAPTYTAGTFEAASKFKNKCEVVRTGTDSEGNVFPDQTGSTLEENFWLRSWSNETYLWNREITDQNPGNFSSPVGYFSQLKTFATTQSGENKDDFHFSQPTSEFLEQRNNQATSGYGARFVAVNGQSAPPRDFRVLYTESNSPASEVVNGQVRLPRGTKLIEIDGESVISGNDVDTLNNGLFPLTAGETHSFVVRYPGAASNTSFNLVSEDIAPEPVNRTKILNLQNGDKVGYMLFNTFSPFASEKSLADAFADLSTQGIDDLVLDLRYNGGGLLAVAAQLGYMVAGDARTAGKTFELLQYNEDAMGTDPTSDSNEQVQPITFIDEGVGFSVAEGQKLSTVNLPRLYILSTGSTCSASEAVINGLRGIDVEIILIGDITCGKPYGFLPTSNCGETYYTIQFRGVNDKNFGDYSDGFVPDDNSFNFGERVKGCTIDDDINNELGDTNEALLKTALYYRENNSCPATSQTKISEKPTFASKMDSELAIIPPQDRPEKSVLRNNMDITLPEGYRLKK